MKKPLKVFPIGGLGEIGMNMMVIEYDQKAIIIDCGVMFSDSRLPGIDLIVPDFRYILDEDIEPLAIILTHGHEDHIGALPFLLRQRKIPVYGSRFTMELVREKLRQHTLLSATELTVVKEGEKLNLDPFNIEFIQMAHSIADALGLAIRTPEGLIIHTGDFKIDLQPADGRTTDLERFKKLGSEGVLLLLSDSTNVEVPGRSVSESSVRAGIEDLLDDTPGWFVLSSFASHIPRMRQVMEIAMAKNRRVHVVGRTMVQNVGIARKLGYIEFPDDLLVDARQAQSIPRDKLIVLSTGTQGEPRSALARMAFDQHKELKLRHGDHVVLSSRFIPGNERAIYAIINHLYRRGAEVFTTKGADVHVSGHAYKEDLRDMLNAVKPKFFIPIHGEYRHLVKHIQLARETGIPDANTFLLEDGQPIEIADGRARRIEPIAVNRSVVDGQELADMGSDVLRDRRQLSEAGIVVALVMIDSHSGELVRKPELFMRGLAFEDQADGLLEEAREALEEQLYKMGDELRTDDVEVQEEVSATVRRFFKHRLERKPVVIPIVIEV